jgi:hypothetical protein
MTINLLVGAACWGAVLHAVMIYTIASYLDDKAYALSKFNPFGALTHTPDMEECPDVDMMGMTPTDHWLM